MPDLISFQELPEEPAPVLHPEQVGERRKLRFRLSFPSPRHRSLMREVFDAFHRADAGGKDIGFPLDRFYVFPNEIELHVTHDEKPAARAAVARLIQLVNEEAESRGAKNL